MSHYPASRSKRHSVQRKHGSLQEPLLLNREASATNASHDPLSLVSSYQSPSIFENEKQSEGSNLQFYGSTNSAVRNHYSHPAHSILATRKNVNPAVDLAQWLCSHGICCCQCVRSQEIGIHERWGQFTSLLPPGLHCMCWPVHRIPARLSLRVRQLDVTCETLTSDHVFCRITASVQFRVLENRCYEAFYSLANPASIMENCILDVVRSTVPTMTLDHIFVSKQELSIAVFARLQNIMMNFGYEITHSLVTHITPNALVRQSMDEIMASRCYKDAASHKAEAAKTKRVKEADAHAERLYLEGTGVAKGRQAIVKGMEESFALFSDIDVRIVKPPSRKEIMKILLVTQYMDLLAHLKPDNLMVVYEPSHVEDLRQRISGE